MDHYREAWERWNDYQGRSGREAFFWFIVPNVLIGIVIRGVDVMMGGQGWLSLLYALLVLVPFASLAGSPFAGGSIPASRTYPPSGIAFTK